jgi:hypothetical protein
MNDELESNWNEAVVDKFLRYYPGIHLEGLRKPQNLSQDSRPSD